MPVKLILHPPSVEQSYCCSTRLESSQSRLQLLGSPDCQTQVLWKGLLAIASCDFKASSIFWADFKWRPRQWLNWVTWERETVSPISNVQAALHLPLVGLFLLLSSKVQRSCTGMEILSCPAVFGIVLCKSGTLGATLLKPAKWRNQGTYSTRLRI